MGGNAFSPCTSGGRWPKVNTVGKHKELILYSIPWPDLDLLLFSHLEKKSIHLHVSHTVCKVTPRFASGVAVIHAYLKEKVHAEPVNVLNP